MSKASVGFLSKTLVTFRSIRFMMSQRWARCLWDSPKYWLATTLCRVSFRSRSSSFLGRFFSGFFKVTFLLNALNQPREVCFGHGYNANAVSVTKDQGAHPIPCPPGILTDLHDLAEQHNGVFAFRLELGVQRDLTGGDVVTVFVGASGVPGGVDQVALGLLLRADRLDQEFALALIGETILQVQSSLAVLLVLCPSGDHRRVFLARNIWLPETRSAETGRRLIL